MATERHDSSPRKPIDTLQVTLDLRSEFLDERPGWVERYLRQLGAQTLSVARADASMAFEASTIAAEFLRNATKHGGGISEFTIAHGAPAEDEPETVYVIATNPAKDESGTPGTVHRGELAAGMPNDEAETGRGLLMTDAYTDHNWGQRNVISPDGRHEIVTFAILSSQGSEGKVPLYEDAA